MFRYDFFVVFLLTHLLGDYVFQTDKIAKLKSKSLQGIFMHGALVCTIQVTVMGIGFGMKGLYAALISSVLHFVIDFVKKNIERYFSKVQILYFIFDQMMHIGIMVGLTFLFSAETVEMEKHIVFIKFLMGVILLTYVLTVVLKMLLRDLYPHLKQQNFFLKYERMIDAMTALIFAAGCMSPIVFSIGIALLAFFLYQSIQKKLFQYDTAMISVKFVVIAVASCAVCIGFR